MAAPIGLKFFIDPNGQPRSDIGLKNFFKKIYFPRATPGPLAILSIYLYNIIKILIIEINYFLKSTNCVHPPFQGTGDGNVLE